MNWSLISQIRQSIQGHRQQRRRQKRRQRQMENLEIQNLKLMVTLGKLNLEETDISLDRALVHDKALEICVLRPDESKRYVV